MATAAAPRSRVCKSFFPITAVTIDFEFDSSRSLSFTLEREGVFFFKTLEDHSVVTRASFVNKIVMYYNITSDEMEGG